jgi:hypothetical protein
MTVTAVYVLNTHRWLYSRLIDDAEPDSAYRLSATIDEADIVIMPVPPWPDPGAPERRLANAQVRHLLRVFLFSQEDRPSVWAPGVYASASARSPLRRICRGGFYVPSSHYEPTFADKLAVRERQTPDLLWSFVGSVETCPDVRGPVLALDDDRALARDTDRWTQELRWHTKGLKRELRQKAQDDYADTLHRSKFVLCPRGRGPATIRLFEAMRAARCPVIVSDEWLPPSGIDWDTCAIRVSERDTPAIPKLLRAREEEAVGMGRQARAIWERHFAPPRMLNTLVEACVDIRSRGSARTAGRIAAPICAGAGRRGLRSTLRYAKRAPARFRTMR